MILKELKTPNYLINVIFITFLLMICFLAFSSQELVLFSFQNEDKVYHILAFIFLSFFFHISFKNTKARFKVFALFMFALFIEIIQHFTDRQANMYDFIASIIGIFLFIISLRIYNKIKHDII